MALTLSKRTINFVMDQGATFEKVIYAQTSAGGNVTISTGTCAAKMRQSTYSGINLYSFSTSVAGSNVTISMTATITGNGAVVQYVYDVEYTQSGGTIVERLAEGIITLSAEATK